MCLMKDLVIRLWKNAFKTESTSLLQMQLGVVSLERNLLFEGGTLITIFFIALVLTLHVGFFWGG